MGNVSNLSTGGTDVNQSVDVNVKQNGFESVAKFFESVGIEKPDIIELNKAIDKDKKPSDPKALGENVKNWIQKMTSKAASGAWSISKSIAADVLTKVIFKFYGLS